MLKSKNDLKRLLEAFCGHFWTLSNFHIFPAEIIIFFFEKPLSFFGAETPFPPKNFRAVFDEGNSS